MSDAGVLVGAALVYVVPAFWISWRLWLRDAWRDAGGR